MSSAATYSFSSELIEQQNTINLLLCELDEKINSKQESEDLKEYVTDLIDKISGNHDGIQGDLNSLLISFKSGLITSDELEKMIIQERDRSNFLITESMGMSKQMKFMFTQFQKLIQSIDETDPVASNAIDNMNSNMHSLLNAIDTLSEIVASPGNEVHSLLESTNKFEARSFDDSPRMSDPKRFQGSRKSINMTVPDAIEVPLIAPIQTKSTPSQYMPAIIVTDGGILLDPVISNDFGGKSDASCQTTLSTTDFTESSAIEITETTKQLPATENLLSAPPYTPVKGVERQKNGSSSKTIKRPTSIKKKRNTSLTSRTTVPSMMSPKSGGKSSKESKKEENTVQDDEQDDEQAQEQEEAQQGEAPLLDLSLSTKSSQSISAPPTDPTIVRRRSQDRMQSALSGVTVKPNSAGRREFKLPSSIIAGPGSELVLGPESGSGSSSDLMSFTQSSPVSHTTPVNRSASFNQSVPVTNSVSVTQSTMVTHTMPVTQSSPVTQFAPVDQFASITHSTSVNLSIPFSHSTAVTFSSPVINSTPVIQSAHVTDSTSGANSMLVTQSTSVAHYPPADQSPTAKTDDPHGFDPSFFPVETCFLSLDAAFATFRSCAKYRDLAGLLTHRSNRYAVDRWRIAYDNYLFQASLLWFVLDALLPAERCGGQVKCPKCAKDAQVNHLKQTFLERAGIALAGFQKAADYAILFDKLRKVRGNFVHEVAAEEFPAIKYVDPDTTTGRRFREVALDETINAFKNEGLATQNALIVAYHLTYWLVFNRIFPGLNIWPEPRNLKQVTTG